LANWKPRIVVLDPHNEYSAAFPGHKRLSTDDGSLVLPYWLLNFSETIALVIGKTEFVATSQANIVKIALLNARIEGATVLGLTAENITVDSPVPYKLSTFIAAVQADKPPQASKQDSHNSILEKLDVLIRDARVAFMMKEWDGAAQDPFPAILSQLVGDDAQPRIVDLSGVPNEVAGVSSAVIARTLFNLKVWQTSAERHNDPVLLVCEEAHRYVPNRGEAQYEAAQEAIRRIAKEGRKYGIGLLLVSQRPSEVEATVLSQCNSWIILRITNESDREHVRAILPDSMDGLAKMLSGLRRQEAIFVGQAAVLPSRILIRSLRPEQLPRSNDIDFDKGWQAAAMTEAQLEAIANKWRYQIK
jgi:DNA helicase HerA-like ATPase